jgi:hypothetical protein
MTLRDKKFDIKLDYLVNANKPLILNKQINV